MLITRITGTIGYAEFLSYQEGLMHNTLARFMTSLPTLLALLLSPGGVSFSQQVADQDFKYHRHSYSRFGIIADSGRATGQGS